MRGQKRPRVFGFRYAVIVVVVVLAVACGSGVTCALLSVRPSNLEVAKPLGSVPVSMHAFDDARVVQVAVSRGVAVPVVSNAEGHVTSYACVAGQPVISGTSFVSINGTPLLSLFTAVPLWRDLALNDKGADVRALQAALEQLGYTVSVDGTYGANTEAAVKRLLTKVDGAAVGMTGNAEAGLPLARVSWIPAASVTPASCDSQLGARIDSGDRVLTTESADAVARVVDIPKNILPGQRVFTSEGVQAPVDADGTITDPASIAALADAAQATVNDSSSNSKDDRTQSPTTVSGQIVLVNPRATASVPPSAIVGVAGNRGCVVSRGRAFPLTIVGSQLGQTFVDFAGAAKPTTVETSPSEATSCR